MVDELDALDLGTSFRTEPQRNNPRRIGLQSEVDDIVPLPAALQRVAAPPKSSVGGGTSTFGLGVLLHSSSCCMRFSASRTEDR